MQGVSGRVVRRLPKELFRVRTEAGHEVVAHVAPGPGLSLSRLLDGDPVRLEIFRTDRSRGRIIGRGPGENRGRSN